MSFKLLQVASSCYFQAQTSLNCRHLFCRYIFTVQRERHFMPSLILYCNRYSTKLWLIFRVLKINKKIIFLYHCQWKSYLSCIHTHTHTHTNTNITQTHTHTPHTHTHTNTQIHTHTHIHTNTLRICNNYCLSTAIMFTRTRHNATLYVHCMYCLCYDTHLSIIDLS